MYLRTGTERRSYVTGQCVEMTYTYKFVCVRLRASARTYNVTLLKIYKFLSCASIDNFSVALILVSSLKFHKRMFIMFQRYIEDGPAWSSTLIVQSVCVVLSFTSVSRPTRDRIPYTYRRTLLVTRPYALACQA